MDSPRDEEVKDEFEHEWEIVENGEVEKEKEGEKFKSLDEMIESSIENFEVKNSLGKRVRRPWEDGLVLDEVLMATIFLQIDMQHEHLQQI